MTRPLLEHVVRRRVAVAGQRARSRTASSSSGSTLVDGRVSGVVVEECHAPADLVVDCSGRSSRIVHQLESSGVLAPPVIA